MSWILAAALVAAPPETTTTATAAPAVLTATAAVSAAADLPTGTLIFSKGDCLAVRVYTQSRFTHVAAVVDDGGRCKVYDSTNGVGVRCLELAEYLQRQTPGEIEIVKPRRTFSQRQCEKFHAALQEQLGRPYSVTHHLTGQRAEGLHCSEYVMDALMAADVMRAKNPPRVSPASLHEGVQKNETYVPVLCTTLCDPPPAPADNWCGQYWLDTKRCTKRCYLKLRGWFCCY